MSDSNSPYPSPFGWKQLIVAGLTLLMMTAMLLWVGQEFDVGIFRYHVLQADPAWLSAGVVCLCFAFLLRGLRLALLMGRPSESRTFVIVQGAALLANLISPLKLGALVKPGLLLRKLQIPVADTLGALVAERLLDLLLLACLLTLAVPIGAPFLGEVPLQFLWGAAFLVALAILGLMTWMRRRKGPVEGAVGRRLAQLTATLGRLRQHPRLLLSSVTSTLILHGLTALGFGCVLAGLPTPEITSSTLFGLYTAVSGAALLIPTPGALGSFEAAGELFLEYAGFSGPAALASIIVVHGVSLFTQAVVGLLTFPAALRRPPQEDGAGQRLS